LKIRFEMQDGDLELYHPDGRRFASFTELAQQGEEERQEKEDAQQRADKEKERADEEARGKAESERRVRDLEEALKRLGMVLPNGPSEDKTE
jgi:hypothetical protein